MTNAATATRVRTCLWFERDAEVAARFYVSLLSNSRIDGEIRPDSAAPPLLVHFTLAGAPFSGLNGGSHYTLSPAASIAVTTEDQAETDRLWAMLTTDGGAPGRCGWLTDRWGVSWQIIPAALPRLLGGADPAASARVQTAMMAMEKIDVAALEAAAASG